MSSSRQEILNPIGDTAARHANDVTIRKKGTGKPVVGLLNNSKPNVAYFLEAVEKDLRAKGCRTVNVAKPRSAGPFPELDALAERCDYVVNAVAD